MIGSALQVVSVVEKFSGAAGWMAFVLAVGLIVHYFDRISIGLARLSRERSIRAARKLALSPSVSPEERRNAREILRILLSEGRALEESGESERGDGDGENGQKGLADLDGS